LVIGARYIRNSELPVLLEAAKERGVVIVTVILRPCLFAETTFKYPDPRQGPQELSLVSLQAANSPHKPLNALDESEQDEVLLSVARRLLKLVRPDPRSSISILGTERMESHEAAIPN
jgi:hypothetical protein